MRFVNAKYEIWEPTECTAENIVKSIERAAKVCYKSEGNIKDGTALPFVKSLIRRGHTSCLEHGNIYLKIQYIPLDSMEPEIHRFVDICGRYDASKSIVFDDPRIHVINKNNEMYIYTNARFLYEKCPKLFWDIILEREFPDYISLFTPEENDPYRRQTVFFTADQRITEEFIRHRVASPNKESTRYCCYASDKHGSELTYIIPLRFINNIHDNCKIVPCVDNNIIEWKINNEIIDDKELHCFLTHCFCSEASYKMFVNDYKWRAEEARILLPIGVKADLVLTNSIIDWCYGRPEPVDNYIPNEELGEVQGKRIKGFFGLRTDGAAHPQARELAIPLMEDFKNRNWIADNEK